MFIIGDLEDRFKFWLKMSNDLCVSYCFVCLFVFESKKKSISESMVFSAVLETTLETVVCL